MICFEDGGGGGGGGFRAEALCLHSQASLRGLGRVSLADGAWEQLHSPESYLNMGASTEWPGTSELCRCQTSLQAVPGLYLSKWVLSPVVVLHLCDGTS